MKNDMILRLKIRNLANEKTNHMQVTISDDATISEMLQMAGCGIGDLSRYYEFSGDFSYSDAFFPFLIVDNQIVYDIPYEEAKVLDFINTFDLAGKVIQIETGYTWAGGPDWCTLTQMWESAKPILENIAILCSISGMSVIGLVKWFCELFKSRKRTPQVCFDIIYSRTKWNHYDLASLLEIEPERAKELLKAFGFIYDNSKKLYIQGELTPQIKEKLTNVKGLDI